jgi:cytochrome c oxidase subunit 2
MMMLNLAESIPQKAIDVAQDGTLESFWMPIQAAEGAADVDFAFYFILAICAFFFFLLVGLGILFLVRYRRRPGYTPLPSPHHSWKLEAIWTGVPIVLTAFMFWFGFSSYMHSRTMPLDANQVSVVGKKWFWTFQYDKFEHTELHVAIDEPTVLTMRSEDVIHSFFIPAFRSKLDVVPGRYSKIWFTPTKLGVFSVFCAEYCGTGHSSMSTKVVVHTAEGLAEWIDENSIGLEDVEPAVGGERFVYKLKGCVACHSVDGNRLVGPSFKGLFGSESAIAGGTTVLADENYIRESILQPDVKIVEGYTNLMPPQTLTDLEIDAFIAYLKTLAN